MSEAIFYVNIHNKYNFLCQLLASRILPQRTNKVVILTDTNEFFQKELSEALWTIIPNSFIPHEINNNTDELNNQSSPILITDCNPWVFTQSTYNILIDLTFTEKQNPAIEKFIFLSSDEKNEIEITRKLYQFHYSLNNHLNHHNMANF